MLLTNRTDHRQPRRWVRPAVLYALAFVLPPIIVGGLSLRADLTASHAVPELPTDGIPEPPSHDPDKLTAVIVAGTTGAESIDLLAPYEVLATSAAFNVYTVGPDRQPLPLFPASLTNRGIHFVPHYSFQGYDDTFDAPPDLLVIPWIPAADRADNADTIAWLRDRAGEGSTLLTICGGSWTAAQAGLLDAAIATTHSNIFSIVERDHPDTTWIRGRRWTEDGNIISAAGISAGIDATLHAITQLVGRDTAQATADALHYPHTRFLDDPTYQGDPVDSGPVHLARAFRWNRTELAVLLSEGVSEIDVAAIVDLYPRTGTNVIHAVAEREGPVETRNGLHLVPDRTHNTTTADHERIVDPRALRDAAPDTFAIDTALADIATHHPTALTNAVIAGIEYPYTVTEEGPPPGGLVLRPVVLGLLGLLLATAGRWRRRLIARRARYASEVTPTGRNLR
jgi:transcriptional regulator GlxA family with amidase domain